MTIAETTKPNQIMDPIDPDLPIPLYHQIYKALSEKIRRGDLTTGTKLPSENLLAAELDVSRITVKRAFNELAHAGLVRRRRGRGTIVVANTDLNFHDGMTNYLQNVAKLRKNTDTQLLSRKREIPPQDVSARLKIKSDTEIEKICHTLSLNGSILSYVETFILDGLTDHFTDEDLCSEALLTLLNRSVVKIQKAEQRILAVNATERIAKILGIEKGSPLLKILCVMHDENERPIEDIYAWYHPDRYQYQMTLTSLNGSGIDQPQRG